MQLRSQFFSNVHLKDFHQQCLKFLQQQLDASEICLDNLTPELNENYFGIKPFFVELSTADVANKTISKFSFTAPTTAYNTLRLLRGMQLNKAILLEGSPGVGKTSLVMTLAKCTNNRIFRINLSDQTVSTIMQFCNFFSCIFLCLTKDISDLFGADLPIEGGVGGQFAWRDGPLLQALKQGHWILLDELNLASQSVLEGLNACLDHRGEVFIPELAKTFNIKPG